MLKSLVPLPVRQEAFANQLDRWLAKNK